MNGQRNGKMSFNPYKTEIMLFSNTEIPELNFTFNGRTIPITNSHKHFRSYI
jgi:hypothetical protein